MIIEEENSTCLIYGTGYGGGIGSGYGGGIGSGYGNVDGSGGRNSGTGWKYENGNGLGCGVIGFVEMDNESKKTLL